MSCGKSKRLAMWWLRSHPASELNVGSRRLFVLFLHDIDRRISPFKLSHISSQLFRDVPFVLWCGWPCSLNNSHQSCRMPFSMMLLPFSFREAVRTNITATKIWKIRPHTNLDRFLPKTNFFGASEAHAANYSPYRVQVRTGQVR